MTIDADLMDTMVRLVGETSSTLGNDNEIEACLASAIAECRRRISAARNLCADGDITREEYLKLKQQNERENAHWRAYNTETRRMVVEMMICVDAIGKLWQL